MNDEKLKKEKIFKKGKAIWKIAWIVIILALRLTEMSNFCEKATTNRDMASITGNSTLGTKNNKHLEMAADEIELKVNKNDKKGGGANEGDPTGEKNEDGGKNHLKKKKQKRIRLRIETSSATSNHLLDKVKYATSLGCAKNNPHRKNRKLDL